LDSVLILACEQIVAALLGLMVEVSGFQPRFPAADQKAAAATASERLRAVLIDCDHPEFDETLIELIRKSGARPILFSPLKMRGEVARLASRHGIEAFTLPIAPHTFARLLTS
jgi:DNA-binding response OmpR family regulator